MFRTAIVAALFACGCSPHPAPDFVKKQNIYVVCKYDRCISDQLTGRLGYEGTYDIVPRGTLIKAQ